MPKHFAASVLFTLIFFIGLIVIGLYILQPFFAALVWAGLLSYFCWSWHKRIQQIMPQQSVCAALISCSLITMLLIVPSILIGRLLYSELVHQLSTIDIAMFTQQLDIPAAIQQSPIFAALAPFIQEMSLPALLQAHTQQIQAIVWQLGTHLFFSFSTFFFTLITLFFFLLHGDKLAQFLHSLLKQALAQQHTLFIYTLTNTLHAVVLGLLITAAAQGFVAGIGYYIFAIPYPIFFAIVTAVIAIIPFGAPLCWGLLVVWLLTQQLYWQAIGLFLWGALLVSLVDNIVRPITISRAADLPFLLVLLGVLGGITTMGLVGLFIGPVVLALLFAFAKQWLITHSK